MACRTPSEVAAEALQTFGVACQVRVPTRATDGAGGYTTTYANGAATYCRITGLGDKIEAPVAERLSGRPGFRVSLPLGLSLTLEHRLVIAGRTFEVVALSEPPAATLARLVVAEVG